MKKIQLFSLALTVLVAFALPAQAAKVIVNGVDAATVDADVVKNVFLGKATKIGGEKVTFAVLSGGAVHEDFLNNVVGKSPSQFLSYWRKLAFSGKGTMPEEFDSEDALVAFVKSTPGAIAYVGDSTATDGVTVVTLD